ncbi:RND efflux system, outer membrane lipoprotein CmeC [Burkholderia singularis]|uniref:RND efflux system, outer membrane lipoprotein CmeC n=1 Tax=Burkholderia singularis TaxID=1503053 RepID=A0A238H7N2_9BURK|nr:RND efflux system, outer membrane lipoprotein CmeC [Burkholderia singularis]
MQANQLTGAQAVSTVNLIRALGGGWGEPAKIGADGVKQPQVAAR